MTTSFLRRGMVEPATFSLFVRRLPPSRGFLVAAGLEDCLAFLENFELDAEDLEGLANLGFGRTDLEQLASLRFTGEVFAVPEGRVILPNEPLLEVTAPLPEAQLVETFLLNQVTYQIAIATKAARCVVAAGRTPLVDFSLRRTQGSEAGLAAARLSAMAGFVATSNVEAARRFGIPLSGTMAHSYVEAFLDERTAFEALAEDFPSSPTFLVDTYDPERGITTAIEVIRSRRLGRSAAIRLDSGDLEALSRMARARLDAAGLEGVRVVVSGSLDEYALARLVGAGAPIDAAGVGTRFGVAADAPFVDTAYKLVAVGGRPVLKLSSGKASLPGPKQVWRRPWGHGDLVATRQEKGPRGAEALLVPVMRGGRRLEAPDSLEASRRRLKQDLEALPAAALDLHHPLPPTVEISERLAALHASLAEGSGAAR